MGLKEETKKANNNRLQEELYEPRREKNASSHKHVVSQKRRVFPRKKPYIIGLLIMGIATIVLFVMLIIMNILPADLTIILVAVVVGLLTLTCFMFSSRYKWKRLVGVLIAAVFIVVIVSATNFLGSTYAMLNKISETHAHATGPKANRVRVTEQPFNIYITGIDQWEHEKGEDLERSDVNMIVSVNPVTKKVLLTSIPRDTYVRLHSSQQMDKITHTGIYGVEETVKTAEDLMSVDMNYYVKLNFTAVRSIIDAMHGITVYSPVEFESSVKGYKYHKGWNKMGGKKALYFARERKSFEGQDEVRVENQQRVVKAVIKKLTKSTTLITSYGEIMDAAGENMSTNMTQNEIKDIVKMQIAELSSWDIQTQKVEGSEDMDYVASLTQKQKFFIYRPSKNSIKKCRNTIEEIMNPPAYELDEAREKRTGSFFINMANRIINSFSKED